MGKKNTNADLYQDGIMTAHVVVAIKPSKQFTSIDDFTDWITTLRATLETIDPEYRIAVKIEIPDDVRIAYHREKRLPPCPRCHGVGYLNWSEAEQWYTLDGISEGFHTSHVFNLEIPQDGVCFRCEGTGGFVAE